MKSEYSLFLMPSGRTYAKLKRIISKLSKELKSPSFEPHLTLVLRIHGAKKDVIEKTMLLSNSVKKFEVRLSGFGYKDEYFRCLFLKAIQSKELMQANAKGRKIFNSYPKNKFFPHLSLLYGNFDTKLKKKIIKDLGKIDIKFKADKIKLYLIGKTPKQWKLIKEFKITN